MISTGFVLVDEKTGDVVRSFDIAEAGEDGTARIVFTLPGGEEIKSPKIGATFGGLKLYQRLYDEEPSPGKWHSFSDSVSVEGNSIITRRSYSKTADIVPTQVSMANARIVLSRAGLLSQINSTIDNSANEELKIAWEYSTVIDRNSPLMSAVAALFSISPSQIDEFFRQAEDISPSQGV